jgi:tetratricopeptide (TPR) repeat protein
MKKPFNLLFVLLLFAIESFLIGCSTGEQPVTKEDAVQFAAMIEKSVNRGDAGKLDSVFDIKSFSEHMMLGTSKSIGKNLMEGAAVGLTNGHFGRQVVRSMGKKGFYQLVKHYEKDNKHHVLFRLFSDNKINYHDFELMKRNDKVKAADVYVYTSGENLSKTMSDALLMMQEKMPGMSKKDLDKISMMKTIRSLMTGGDYVKANEYYDQLPAEFKKQKLFQVIHVQITSQLGENEYSTAMEEYRASFPNDPNMHLLMIDAYILKKEYSKALESINKVDSLIDKDVFLDYYRSFAYKLMEDKTSSRKCLERLHTNMPAFKDGIIELLSNYLDAKETGKAVSLMKDAERKKQLAEDDLQYLFILYPDFKSDLDAAGK